MNATISLALIVRDSSKTLDRCLSTARDAVDEIVVVDTGSIDDTVAIAKKYTDKVYFFEWIDDFAAARNYSFDRCTKDFIFWLDSDDYMLPEDVQKIKDMDFSDKEIIISKYAYARDEYGNVLCYVPRERILKRSLNLRWQEPIHEYFPMNGKVFNSDILVQHNKQHGTSERNLSILERITEKSNFSRNYYYLGSEYLDFNRLDEAIKYLQMFVESSDAYWEDIYQAHYKLAQCHFIQKNDEKFKYHIFKSIEIEERRAEPFYLLGLYCMNKGQHDKAIQWYELCLRIKRPAELLTSHQPEYYTYKPCLNLGYCYNVLGDIQKAYEYNKEVLKYMPTDTMALNNDKILERALQTKKESEKTSSGSKKDGQGKKLNVGCGNKPMPGYVNVDLFKGPIVDEIFEQDNIPYVDGSISGIHSEHSLEHVTFERVEKTLKEWFRVLCPGGDLLLKMPDLVLNCMAYLNPPAESVNGFPAKQWFKYTIFGIQKSQAGEPDEAQIHKSGYSKEEMGKILEDIGFIIDYNENYNGWGTLSYGIRCLKPVNEKKISWIAPMDWNSAQTRIRVLNVDRWFRSRGYVSRVFQDYQDVLNSDIIIVGKSFSKQDYQNIQILKQKGKRVYADVCESLFEFPWFKEILSVCDKVICCSQALYEQAKSVNNNCVVIEDAWES